MWKSHLTYKLWEIRARKAKSQRTEPDSFHFKPGPLNLRTPVKAKQPSLVSSRSKADEIFAAVHENQKIIPDTFSGPNQTLSTTPEKKMPLSPDSSGLRQSSSFSPTPRKSDLQNFDPSDTDPGETYSPVFGADVQDADGSHSKTSPILSPTRLTNSEIEHEKIISPRSPLQNVNRNKDSLSKTRLTPIESRATSGTEFQNEPDIANMVKIN